MNLIKYNNISNDKKILFISTIEDKSYLKELSIDILRIEEVEIYYNDNNIYDLDKDVLSNLLLVFYPITKNLLNNLEIVYYIKEIIKLNIPMLPIMVETGLESYFNTIIGEYELINRVSNSNTELPYEDKLNKYIHSVIVDAKLTNQILDNYVNRIFLSYRKINRNKLNELIKIIRSDKLLDTSCIWYDEFLSIGEEYNQIILNEITKCDVFIMLITKEILEDNNYVHLHEYPDAVKLNKTIIGISFNELSNDNLNKLHIMYPMIDKIYSPNQVLDILHNLCLNNKPYDSYLLTLGKLYGIGTIKNIDESIVELNELVDKKNIDSINILIELYTSGTIINKDILKSIELNNILIDTYQEKNFFDENIELINDLFKLFNLYFINHECNKMADVFERILYLMFDEPNIIIKNIDINDIKKHTKLNDINNMPFLLSTLSDLLYNYLLYYSIMKDTLTYTENYEYLCLLSLLDSCLNYQESKEYQYSINKLINIVSMISIQMPMYIPSKFLFDLIDKISDQISEVDRLLSIINISSRYKHYAEFINVEEIELIKKQLFNVIKLCDDKNELSYLNIVLQAWDILNIKHEYNDEIDNICKKIKDKSLDDYYLKLEIIPDTDSSYYIDQFDYLLELSKQNGYYLYSDKMLSNLDFIISDSISISDNIKYLNARIEIYNNLYSEFKQNDTLIDILESYLKLAEYYIKINDITNLKDTYVTCWLELLVVLDYVDESDIYSLLARFYQVKFMVDNNIENKKNCIKKYINYIINSLDEDSFTYDILVIMFLEELYKYTIYCLENKIYDVYLLCLEKYFVFSSKIKNTNSYYYKQMLDNAWNVFYHESMNIKHIYDYDFVDYLNNNRNIDRSLFMIYTALSLNLIANNKWLKYNKVNKYCRKHQYY